MERAFFIVATLSVIISMLETNKIYNVDCLEFMKTMPDKSVDLTITSPPYNIGGNNHKQGEYDTIDDTMDKDEYFSFIVSVMSHLIRITKYHVFFNIAETSGNFGIITELRKRFDQYLKETFIWVKTNPVPTFNDKQMASAFEYIFCFSHDTPENRQFYHSSFHNKNSIIHQNVFCRPVNSGKNNAGHHFAFSLWLPEYFSYNFSLENELVFDPFMGSGTTAIACLKTNRRFIGCEISEKYCALANKRIDIFLSQGNLFSV